MDADERKEMYRLCSVMQTQQNATELCALLEQLNDLLDRVQRKAHSRGSEEGTSVSSLGILQTLRNRKNC